jgi:transcriptional regulator with XRE-family HTH domain
MKNFAERLKSARKMNGYSLQDLADNMAVQISKQALNKYESGVMKPDSEILSALCKALNVSSDYFNRETTFSIDENVSFRKLKKLSAKEQEKVKQKTADFLERYFELENLLGISAPFHNPNEGF